jgi:hypothetical protein
MPFKDLDKEREYNKKYRAERRTSASSSGIKPAVPGGFNVRDPEQLQELLAWVVNEICDDEKADILSKGRVLAQLIQTGQKLIETADFSERLAKIEEHLNIGATVKPMYSEG